MTTFSFANDFRIQDKINLKEDMDMEAEEMNHAVEEEDNNYDDFVEADALVGPLSIYDLWMMSLVQFFLFLY